MLVEDSAVSQNRIKMLYKSTVLVASSAEILAPKFQTERKQVCEKRPLDVGTAEILQVPKGLADPVVRRA